jgi:signal transduction histidine kinase
MTSTPLDLPRQLDLNQLISDEAHDLRSPFNQIVGFSKMLLNDPSPAYPLELQKEDAATVHRNGQRALLLMNSLIDIARLNRHEKETSPAQIELTALFEQSLAYWRRFNPASQLHVEYQISAAATHLEADDLLLRQILSGCIMIVAQYIEPEGSVRLTIEEEPAWWVFRVSSAGKKATPFSKLDLKMQGYLSRALIELQQGEIRAAEETDDGASIQFALPRA